MIDEGHDDVLFFFSSRRRHTRWNCDWSSTCALPICGVLLEHGRNQDSLRFLRRFALSVPSRTVLTAAEIFHGFGLAPLTQTHPKVVFQKTGSRPALRQQ